MIVVAVPRLLQRRAEQVIGVRVAAEELLHVTEIDHGRDDDAHDHGEKKHAQQKCLFFAAASEHPKRRHRHQHAKSERARGLLGYQINNRTADSERESDE